MKPFTLLCLLACLFAGIGKTNAQEPGEHVLGQIGWTFTLPPNFNIVSETDATQQNKSLSVSAPKTLVNGKKDDLNYFNVTITPFGDNWKLANAQQKRIIYEAYQDEMPGVTLDSVSTKATIAGVTFDKFTVKIVVRAAHLTSVLYSTLYN